MALDMAREGKEVMERGKEASDEFQGSRSRTGS